MAWDDLPPDAGAASWDSAPPKPEELAPSFLEKTASNVLPDLKSVIKGAGDVASGPAVDIMSGDPASAIPKLVKEGRDFFAHPKENAAAMVRPVTHPIDYFQEHPVQQTLNVAGALAGAKGLVDGVPEAVKPPEAPKGLPVMEPGAKTGDPHALFAYNDAFGPGGATRSIYNVFGDPEHPAIKAIGHGSSVEKTALDKAGIPVVGREPKSVGKYEPIESKPYAGEMTYPEGMTSSASPERPASAMWENDPGAMVGEPVMTMKNGKVAIVLNETDQGEQFYTVHDDTGKQFGGNFAEPNDAAKYAESVVGGGKQPSPPSEPSKPPLGEQIANDATAKATEVKDYISRGYKGFAQKPGAVANLADYVQEKSQMMSAQQMGFTPLQNRQLGANPTQQLETMRAIGQYGMDAGIVSPTGGLRHMVEANAKLLDQAGKTIGDIRKQADALRDPAKMPIDPLQAIKQQLDPVFARGARSGETGSYAKALETVEDAQPTFQGMAEAATKLNHAANEANRLNQPHGAFTDVANALSRIENERIRQLMPEKAAAYEQALKEFGINKKIEQALKRKVGGETKRMGPGSLTSNLVQKGLDEVGYRVGAKAANKLSTSILSKPSVAKNLPSLFKEFANHVDETAKEVSGMYSGGKVPDDVRNYVQSRAC